VTDIEREWMARQGISLCDDLDVARLRGVAKLQQRLSVATLVKLVLAEHFSALYDKILYLDVDLTIHGDVSAIFALDTGEFALAAVPAGRRWPVWLAAEQAQFREHAARLGMTEPYRFINTGVLLIDVAKWNREAVGPRALDFIRRHAELCSLPDEHGLNAVLDGRQAEISPLWNMRPSVWTNPAVRETAEPVIIHYIGIDKPWKKYGYGKRIARDRPALRLYRDFVRDTPWQAWLDAQWTSRDFCKNLLYETRLISRRVRGKPSAPPTRRQLRLDAEDFHRYCMDTPFADVDQGIVTREGGRLRLNRQLVAAA
jgi:lipopolysaccharide biosynthesis glycosyltransferase